MLAVTSLVLCFLSLEVVLRIRHRETSNPMKLTPAPYRINTERGSRLIPGSDVLYCFESTTQPVRVRVNSLGFRGPEIQTGPHRAVRRLLILGDSVAFGYGVEEGKIFPALTDSVLKRTTPPWEVVNASVEDIGIKEQRMILEEKGSLVSPDAVLIAFYANDSRSPVGFDGEFLQEDPVDRWFRTHPGPIAKCYVARFLHFRYRLLLTKLHLYRSPIAARFAWVEPWKLGKWKDNAKELIELIEMAKYDWGAVWFEDGWAVVGKELARIKELCAELDATLLVMYLPVQVQIETSVELTSPQEDLREICIARDVPFLDPMPALQGHEALYIDQCHFTERGHRLVAGVLLEWLDGVLCEN